MNHLFISSASRRLLLLMIVLSASSCGRARIDRPNIVLIVIDTLRPDHLAIYGYPRGTAPFLEEIAGRGVVFENAYSTSSWTAPATASLMTSLYPVQHGVRTGILAWRVEHREDAEVLLHRIPETVTTLSEMLREAGYRTFGVADNVNITREMGFAQGFDRFWSLDYEGARAVNAIVTERAGLIQEEGPYFLYLHYMDPHRPYHRREPWYEDSADELAATISAYDSEISYVDEHIRQLYALLDWDQNTILLITSDHGEEFLDHGGWDHGRTLYSEVIRVPLIVHSSAESLHARHVPERVSILDIAPTVCEFAGADPLPGHMGASFRERLHSDNVPLTMRPHYASLRSAPWFGGRSIGTVIQDPFKYILTRPDVQELYDLRADPDEQTNLAEQRPELVEELDHLLREIETGCRKYPVETVTLELDQEKIERLKSLGYIR